MYRAPALSAAPRTAFLTIEQTIVRLLDSSENPWSRAIGRPASVDPSPHDKGNSGAPWEYSKNIIDEPATQEKRGWGLGVGVGGRGQDEDGRRTGAEVDEEGL